MKALYEFFWTDHGTKLLGWLAFFVATALLIPDLIPTNHMKYWLFANALFGGATVKRGYTNTQNSAPPPKEAGFIRPLMLGFLLAFAVPVTLMLPGCGIQRPIEEAVTLEQKAFATYGSFVIVKEQGAQLLRDPSVPDSIKQSLRDANNAVTEPITLMYEAVIALKIARDDLAAGRTTEAQVILATQKLLEWYAIARPLYDQFDSQIQQVRK